MRILVTGAGGLLAGALRQQAPDGVELISLGHAELDLTNTSLMEQRLAGLRPEVVINTAAYNAVDQCEAERDLSWAVNATGPQCLAERCAARGIRLVHFGTDYIFDGAQTTPYSEGDAPNPINHYAAGKLAGERAVLAASPCHLVLRPSWIFGQHATKPRTYVHAILRQAIAGTTIRATTDQASVPTYAPDLARWVFALVQCGAAGLFHAVNDEGLSRFEWTKVIVAEALDAGIIKEPVAVEPVRTTFFNPNIRRSPYNILSNRKLAALLGETPGSWRRGLREMLHQPPWQPHTSPRNDD